MTDNEFGTSTEYSSVNEYPAIRESFTEAYELPPVPDEFAAPQKTYTGSGINEDRKKKNRKLSMMYAAAITTSVIAVAGLTPEPERFDLRAYIDTHRNWYNALDDEFIYLGDDGWAWSAIRSEDGEVFDDFYHYKRWRYEIKDTDEYSFSGYGIDIDWSDEVPSTKESNIVVNLVATDAGYVIEAAEVAHPGEVLRFIPLDNAGTDYPGKDYMTERLGYSMQEMINEFNTYKLIDDAPVYNNVDELIFDPDGTGRFYVGRKEYTFTYKPDDEIASPFITVYFKGEYEGKSARAYFVFLSEKPTMLLFGGLEDSPDSFGAFIAQ